MYDLRASAADSALLPIQFKPMRPSICANMTGEQQNPNQHCPVQFISVQSHKLSRNCPVGARVPLRILVASGVVTLRLVATFSKTSPINILQQRKIR